jgi:hypothetical protein
MRVVLLHRVSQVPHFLKRTMSTKYHYLVMVSDFPGTVQKKLEVRPQHLAAVPTNPAILAGGDLRVFRLTKRSVVGEGSYS